MTLLIDIFAWFVVIFFVVGIIYNIVSPSKTAIGDGVTKEDVPEDPADKRAVIVPGPQMWEVMEQKQVEEAQSCSNS